jgi:hypothetical protein
MSTKGRSGGEPVGDAAKKLEEALLGLQGVERVRLIRCQEPLVYVVPRPPDAPGGAGGEAAPRWLLTAGNLEDPALPQERPPHGVTLRVSVRMGGRGAAPPVVWWVGLEEVSSSDAEALARRFREHLATLPTAGGGGAPPGLGAPDGRAEMGLLAALAALAREQREAHGRRGAVLARMRRAIADGDDCERVDELAHETIRVLFDMADLYEEIAGLADDLAALPSAGRRAEEWAGIRREAREQARVLLASARDGLEISITRPPGPEPEGRDD